MCLRFVFLLITRTTSWLQLSRGEETWRIAEILILRHQLAVLQRRQPRRPKLNWADRALLATLLGAIPKARRQGLRLQVTPDTMLRWHRDIVRRRWAARSMRGKAGLPATRKNIKTLVLRLARENPEWGYRRIHGELAGLGVKIAVSTVWEILKKAGIDPAPHLLSTGSPDPRQLPFGPGIRPYPTSYAQTTRRRVPVLRPAVSCCLSAIGIGFLGHPAPAGDLNLPHGRPTGPRNWPDPNGVVVLHMSKLRPGRAPPLSRGRWCAPGRRLSSARHLPLSCGQSLRPR